MLFGTNGIRGIVGKELTPNFCMELSQAFGSLYGREVAIGSDSRLSSEMIKKACSAALLSVGCDVVDLGYAPTPAIQHFIKTSSATGGLIITASHNPPEFNGIKTVGGDGIEISKDEEARVERLYRSISGKLSLFSPPPSDIVLANWNDIGRFSASDPLRGYIDGIKKMVDINLIRSKDLRVAVDCGNGVGALATPNLLKELGCSVVTLNGNLDGSFTGRSSEPTRENIADLISLMGGGDFDLGIAHDGDADRAVFVTEGGEFVEGDYSLAIFARDALKKRGEGGFVIPTGVNTSSVLWDVAKEYGGEVRMMKVGPMAIARAMMDLGSPIGGEGNGGVIFPEFQYCRDGGMASAKMAEIVAGGTLSELLKRLPKYHMSKRKIPCPNELKELVVGKGLEHLTDRGAELVTIDGVKAYLEDGWVLIRPSGTEPIIRVEGEAKDKNRAEELTEEYIDKVKDWIEEAK
jgi:phosphomannomutase/phosphoglucomutase